MAEIHHVEDCETVSLTIADDKMEVHIQINEDMNGEIIVKNNGTIAEIKNPEKGNQFMYSGIPAGTVTVRATKKCPDFTVYTKKGA